MLFILFFSLNKILNFVVFLLQIIIIKIATHLLNEIYDYKSCLLRNLFYASGILSIEDKCLINSFKRCCWINKTSIRIKIIFWVIHRFKEVDSVVRQYQFLLSIKLSLICGNHRLVYKRLFTNRCYLLSSV